MPKTTRATRSEGRELDKGFGGTSGQRQVNTRAKTNLMYIIPRGADFQRSVAPEDYMPPANSRNISYASSSSCDFDFDDEEENSENEGQDDQEGDVVYIGTSPHRSLDKTRSSARMAPQDSAAAKAFKNMPLEIHQQIALFLPADSDVHHYSLICRKAGSAISASVWRRRFLQNFDDVLNLTPRQIKQKYAYRRDVSKKWTMFDLTRFGSRISAEDRLVQEFNQFHSLVMLRSLILESNASMAYDDKRNKIVQGRNLRFIEDLATGQNGSGYLDVVDSTFCTSIDADASEPASLDTIFTAARDDSFVYVVQLCLTPIALDPRWRTRVFHFDISQYQAYATRDCQPLFTGDYLQEVNVRWALHVVNFFKYHLKSEGEGLLEHDYKDLEPSQLPQFWVGNINGGTQPLARHWKGAYLYMEPEVLSSVREWHVNNGSVHTDSLDGDETFQDLDFFFDDAQYNKSHWPMEYDNILCSDPFAVSKVQTGRRRARNQVLPDINKPEIKQFWGSCRGSRRGHFFGRIHAVTTQQGFHGFQRLTLMKYYTKLEAGEYVYDPSQVYAYEGCVLPGGRIIIGRWWNARADPNDKATSAGPFIWWNVVQGDAVEPIKEHEAFDFLDSFQDPLYIEGGDDE